MYTAEPEEGDDPVEHGGVPLLYVSRRVSAAFDGCVDLTEAPEGVGFSIGPPEAGRGHAPRTKATPRPHGGVGMTSEETRIGIHLRVREGHRSSHVRGKTGIVTHT